MLELIPQVCTFQNCPDFGPLVPTVPPWLSWPTYSRHLRAPKVILLLTATFAILSNPPLSGEMVRKVMSSCRMLAQFLVDFGTGLPQNYKLRSYLVVLTIGVDGRTVGLVLFISARRVRSVQPCLAQVRIVPFASNLVLTNLLVVFPLPPAPMPWDGQIVLRQLFVRRPFSPRAVMCPELQLSHRQALLQLRLFRWHLTLVVLRRMPRRSVLSNVCQ